MKILELIQSRRTIHSFSSEVVSNEILEEAISAAIQAPNHRLTWPWRFFILGPKARQVLCGFAKSEKYAHCGALVVLAIVRASDEERRREDYASMACAVQNMSLYLHAQGWGSKWSTGKVSRSAEMHQLLQISPDEYDLCGMLWIGKAKEVPAPPVRPPVAQFAKYLD